MRNNNFLDVHEMCAINFKRIYSHVTWRAFLFSLKKNKLRKLLTLLRAPTMTYPTVARLKYNNGNWNGILLGQKTETNF